MNIDMNSITIDKKIVFPAIVFIFILVWVFFANASGFSLKEALFLEKYEKTISLVLSQNFLISFFLFPLPFVFAALTAKRMERKQAMKYCAGAAAAAAIISIIIFPVALEHALFFVFYVISFLAVIEYAELGFMELKRYVTARAVGSAVGKASIILAFGLFVASAQIIMPNGEYVKSFENALKNTASSQKMGGMDLVEIGATQMVDLTKQSFDTVTKNQSFEKLREKNDPDVVAFVAQVDYIYSQINSEQYKQSAREQVKANQEKMLQSQSFSDAFETIKQQFPEFQRLEEMLWFFEAMGAASLFLFFANFILGPLSMLLGALIENLYPAEEEEQATQNQ